MAIRDKIEILKGDITQVPCDAIVNAANTTLLGGGGVDGAIHRAAGPQLKEYCYSLKGCNTGEAKTSPGFKLKAKYVIHTVGPVWIDGKNDEPRLLKSCYINSLKEAVSHRCNTIAFPCISTGVYRFPFDFACTIALEAINTFLQSDNSIKKIFLVVFSEGDYQQYMKIFSHYFEKS